MFRNLAIIVFILVPAITHAQLESQFVFNGQNAEVLTSEQKVMVEVEEEVQVPSMCARQVPYQENVCRQVTKYKESCRTVPAHKECNDEEENQCRTVTRYEEVCSGSSSRTVCTERPTREVCTTRPNGTQHCTTVGGGQSCHEVPGNEVCRNVPYQDEECETVTRNVCRNVPAARECSQVPYEERVCAMETKYRTETYACTETQIRKKTVQKVIKSETNVQILTNGIVEEFPVKIAIKDKAASSKEFVVETSLLKEPKAYVIVNKQVSKVAAVTATEIQLKNTVVIEVLTESMLPISFPVKIASASIEEATSKLLVIFEGSMSPMGSVELQITHKAFLSSRKTIAELEAKFPSEKASLGIVEDKAALSIDLKEALKGELQKKNMLLKFTLTSPLVLQGQILNTVKPVTSKLYEGTFVQLK